WSSDVCSSDLRGRGRAAARPGLPRSRRLPRHAAGLHLPCAAAVRTVPNDGRASAQQVGCLTEFFSPGLTTHGQGRTLFDRKEEEVTEGWGPPKRPRQRKLR